MEEPKVEPKVEKKMDKEKKENHKETPSMYKNYGAPILFIIIVPIILFYVLKKSTTISQNIFPNLISLVVLLVFLLWGYASLRLFPQNFEGPKNVDGTIPKYQGNGFRFWIASVIVVVLVCLKWKKVPEMVTTNFIPIIMTFNIFGLLFVGYLYFAGRKEYWGKEEDDKKEYSGLFRFYRGLEFHPRIGGVDIKQLTNCRFGMIFWQVIIIIFAFFSYYTSGFNVAMWVTVILQTIYIAKFFWWETGYFNTLDITLDRAGYYICWGCLVFLPAFYTFTCYYLANNPSIISGLMGCVILLLGVWFIWMNYKVDKEKEDFKANPECKIWGKKAEYINCAPILADIKEEGKKPSKLLVSGWWGKSRHMNYTYEIGLSGCWSAVGAPVGIAPFAYLGYIIALLVHRIYRDEDKCKVKYGKYWDEYCKKVPARLIPGIY
jgi:7-dehydrocholesterol reductase